MVKEIIRNGKLGKRLAIRIVRPIKSGVWLTTKMIKQNKSYKSLIV